MARNVWACRTGFALVAPVRGQAASTLATGFGVVTGGVVVGCLPLFFFRFFFFFASPGAVAARPSSAPRPAPSSGGLSRNRLG